MVLAILLALAASLCTATSSVCQRLGARHLAARSHDVTGTAARGFDVWLVFRLARQPTWLAGFGFMILGFIFQISALHFGPLALVQPILAVELVIVFGYLAILTRCRGVRWWEWLAAMAMFVGVGVFLGAASPSGGRPHGPAASWWSSGLAVQPGFTIFDPVVAIVLGVSLFGERLQATPGALAAQVFGLFVLAAGVFAVSRSGLITNAHAVSPGRPPSRTGGELARKSR